MLFQLNPSSSMIINRARLTSAAGETRDRVNDTNARRSSLVRLKTDCMLHIVLLKSMLHNTSLNRQKEYDSWHESVAGYEVSTGGLTHPWHITVARLLPDLRGQRVLEIGCGRGDFAVWLAARYP